MKRERKSPAIAVFIPVFQEEETLQGVIGAVREELPKATVIVSDDCSRDRSVEIANECADIALTSSQNTGNGAATRRALTYLSHGNIMPEYVIRIDGDGQHDPTLLPSVVERLHDGADVVVCSRFSAESDMTDALDDRIFLNETAAFWMSRTTGWSVTDARSGFLGFRWSMLREIVRDLRTEKYGIPLELLLRFWHRFPDAKHVELPHPAKYGRGISGKLDDKYSQEVLASKVARLAEAYRVFLSTYAELGMTVPKTASRAKLWLRTAG